MWVRGSSRPKHIAEMAVVILNVFLAFDLKLILFEAVHFHYSINAELWISLNRTASATLKRMRHTRTTLPYIAAALCVLAARPVLADSAADPGVFNSPQLRITLTPRSAEQMAGFYEARGFSRDMIEVLHNTCYITVGIENKSTDILWLDLAQWRFTDSEGAITRLDRDYWHALWTKQDIPLAHQSTFRWTLLPEQLDFRPAEREGGNITLPRHKRPMRITAQFAGGADRSGKAIEVHFDNVLCAEDAP